MAAIVATRRRPAHLARPGSGQVGPLRCLASTIAQVARTLSSSELSSETGASLGRLEWLTGLGILRPRTPGVFTYGDVFRVKMVESLFAAGFSAEQVEAAVAETGLDLQHVDRYVFQEPAERSPRTFEQFASEVGPDASRLLPAVYQLLGLTPPDPASHLPVDEEALLREFFDAVSTMMINRPA